jgi:hypothetical protein
VSDHAARLRADLDGLGWSARQLADWLSQKTGDHIALTTVQRWLTEAAWGRACPGWPHALLVARGLTACSEPRP